MTQGAIFPNSVFSFDFFLARLPFSAVPAGGSYELGLIPGDNCRSFLVFQIRSAKRLPHQMVQFISHNVISNKEQCNDAFFKVIDVVSIF